MKALRYPMLLCLAAVASTSLAHAQNAVTAWNSVAANVIVQGKATAGMGGIYLAYTDLAIYNALNAIQPRFQTFGPALPPFPNASPDAAVATAAHDVLVYYFPLQQPTIDAAYLAYMMGVADGQPKLDGISLGHQAAAGLLALRANDGLNAQVSYTFLPAGPGIYQRTPPAFPNAQTPQIAQMQPFTMTGASQFLPEEGPPALDSQEWADDYNRTKDWGAIDSPLRTPEQTEIGLFWTANPGPQFVRMLQGVVTDQALDVFDTGRLEAMFFTAAADSFVGCMNAKYHFNFWRPVTAIREGDTDGNPATDVAPSWTPLAVTPNHPEYPAAHGCVTAAISDVVAGYFGTSFVTTTFTSTPVPGGPTYTHTFTNTGDWLREVEVARIYGGMHYTHSVMQGAVLGHKVARQLLRNFFQPIE